MSKRTVFFFLIIITIPVLSGACTTRKPHVIQETVYVYQTATLVTPTLTTTPTPTLTPTPTAQTGTVSGHPRSSILAAPVPQDGAPCGIVDTLDFPLDPPDAEDAYGGGDYGIFRSRFNGNHTGEDWGFSRRSSFGKPVYSIGHGYVTYADPDGWGADKGTVIIRHTFPDGSSLLSFYGHLDPPSVVIRAGECLARDDKVGEIGDPTTSPHLHFEIRTIYPYQATRGYVSIDPTELGWLPPSATINSFRIRISPGVVWTKPSPHWRSEPVGQLGDNSFVIANNLELMGVDLLDGTTLWQYPFTSSMAAFMIDHEDEIIYMVNRMGLVEAFEQVQAPVASSEYPLQLEKLWSYDLERRGPARLIPLPDGGAALSSGSIFIALSEKGELLWNEDPFPQLGHWRTSKDSVYVTTESDESSLWLVRSSAPPEFVANISGKIAVTDELFWIYNDTGISILNKSSNELELLYSLPTAFPSLGELEVLPDGNVLLIHTDIYDRRLLVFKPDGSLQWERSFSGALPGQPLLLPNGNTPILISQDTSSQAKELDLYSLELDDANLVRIFEAGTRNLYPRATWAVTLDGHRILLNIGGNQLLLLDPESALKAVENQSPG